MSADRLGVREPQVKNGRLRCFWLTAHLSLDHTARLTAHLSSDHTARLTAHLSSEHTARLTAHLSSEHSRPPATARRSPTDVQQKQLLISTLTGQQLTGSWKVWSSADSRWCLDERRQACRGTGGGGGGRAGVAAVL